MTRPSARRTISRLRLAAGAALLAGGLSMTARAADDQITRGAYLTTMGDCVGCHAGTGYPLFAGGRYMDMPFGKISTPNITPDKQTGIGNYTDAQFIRLMRHGVSSTGEWIYPAMPYPWYNTMPDSDLLAIKAYLFSLKPVHAPRLPNKIWFPFNIRPAIAIWDAFFVPGRRFKPDPTKSALWNRGDYIVNGPEHCGECHNTRNFLGNTAAALNVQGGSITMWYAPSLRPDKLTGIGSYSVDDLVKFFKGGWSEAMGPVAGPMGETIDYSTSQLSNDDLKAIATYITSLKPIASYAARTADYRQVRYAAGQADYLEHCASCHQLDGNGIKDRIPALNRNGMVRAFGPQDVIRVVIGGHPARGPYMMMPGVGAAMTNEQVADVSNYIRQSWDNHAPSNASTLLVGLIRRDTHTLQDGERPNGCPDLDQPELKQIIADKSNGVGALLADTHTANMLQNINTLITKVKAAAPTLKKDTIVNGLTDAYCPVVASDTALPESLRSWTLVHFANRLYVQLSTNEKY